YAAGVDDLEVSWLRKMRDGSPGGQVFGTIVASADPPRSNLRQIRVRLVQDGRPIAETRTDIGGRFDFGWRAPGTYVLEIAPSERFISAVQPIVVPPIGPCTPIPQISVPRR